MAFEFDDAKMLRAEARITMQGGGQRGQGSVSRRKTLLNQGDNSIIFF
ncbi:MAG: hypothetical protein AVDCRST_MAG93-8632 [uncultured Chloroflexia bacterium]|uniref:Uncharacterized protein n=1 Tax=uncultured Chloroflexia bacterium TaxID=1672391 RepID=A0A6J4N1E6_9CHLR|nr:MAG: hypothetical protein AVDCRST_MAG93-8632 [uncultured Chloroflexia bacterium]